MWSIFMQINDKYFSAIFFNLIDRMCRMIESKTQGFQNF